jgi:hypothetical protein
MLLFHSISILATVRGPSSRISQNLTEVLLQPYEFFGYEIKMR